ncbi:S8 family serine peptidase [Hyalangium minutum]|uniref:Alkaline serine exoprotease A n=1 Tax=Hyalangium minutum TaxID=394096 RepID=A0A085WWM1_9BACT|nr:S8 family serine peptidase [Hyalangium minutum]KFE72084.1 hypothetical protein DB31_0345 [Hyalangium minutum]
MNQETEAAHALGAESTQGFLRSEDPIPGQYIVVLKEADVPAKDVLAVASTLAFRYQATVLEEYQHALRGFAIAADENQARALAADPLVKYVVEDGVVRLADAQLEAPWGLDRIDQRNRPLDGVYRYNQTGVSVHAYIFDTGIRTTHVEFGGRASADFTVINDGRGAEDCNGHGTHVAGTIGGQRFGLAKGVQLHSVRVLNCNGSGTWSGVIAAIEWVTTHQVKPAVANMSLGGAANPAVDDAIRGSISQGILYVVAAINNGDDACKYTPSRIAEAMTVGATDSSDARPYFSNFGSCLDMFAPGVNITSAWFSSDTATKELTGTSMAAPHVTGAAALYLEINPNATPAAVSQALNDRATSGVVSDPGAGSPNRLLFAFSEPQRWVSDFGYEAGGWRVENHPRMMADVNGDGRQDIVGFGNAGVYVSLSTGSSFTPPQLWVAGFGYEAGGWRVEKHPRMMADVNRDGRQDIVGFGNAGVSVSLSTGSSFTPPQLWVADFGYEAGGWRVENHPRMMADVNRDGRQDVVGFGNAGVYVALSTGSSFTPPQLWVTDFGYEAGGWRVEKHPRMMADVNGDGMQDVVGFGNAGVYVALSTGSGFATSQLWVADFGYEAGGWRVENHPRMMADVNGDGRQDVVGFGNAGVFVALSTGSSFAAPQLWVADFGYEAGGWRVENHPRMTAEVNDDGRQDIVGFGNAGVYIALSTGSNFTGPQFRVDSYGWGSGWLVGQDPRMMADVNGDGRQDIVGFGSKAVFVTLL